jgi:hypothetical protein
MPRTQELTSTTKKRFPTLAERKLSKQRTKEKHQKLRFAVMAVFQGEMDLKHAAKEYGVPLSTLRTWKTKGLWKKPDSEFYEGNRRMPQHAEDVFADFISASAKLGTPMLKSNVLAFAYAISSDCKGKAPPSTQMLGWFRGFIERQGQRADLYLDSKDMKLKVRSKPQAISRCRI